MESKDLIKMNKHERLDVYPPKGIHGDMRVKLTPRFFFMDLYEI